MMNFNSQKIEINCPECNRSISVTLQQIANQATVKCMCSQFIQLQDKNGSFKKGVNDMNKSMKDLENAFKKLGRLR